MMVIKLLNVSLPSINNYWIGGGSRRYVCKKGVEFKRLLRYKAKEKGIKPTKKPIALSVHWIKKDRRKRDIDNILKPILDALSGIAYYDDSQVTQLFVTKAQGTQDSLEITIKHLPHP